MTDEHPPAPGDKTHYVGDDCPGGHRGPQVTGPTTVVLAGRDVDVKGYLPPVDARSPESHASTVTVTQTIRSSQSASTSSHELGDSEIVSTAWVAKFLARHLEGCTCVPGVVHHPECPLYVTGYKIANDLGKINRDGAVAEALRRERARVRRAIRKAYKAIPFSHLNESEVLAAIAPKKGGRP